jgi:SAM-dependent methyltransferase
MDKFRELDLLKEFYMGLELRKKLDNVLLDAILKRSINYILDVGIGFAGFAKKLLDNSKKVYGIEIDKDRIEYISHNIDNPNLVVKQKDATKLDFNEEFDGVYCISLCQIGKYLDVIKGMYSALKPGGWLFVDLYVIRKDDTDIQEFRKWREEFFNRLSESEKKPFQEALEKDTSSFEMIRKKPEEWEEILRSIGFKIEEKINYYPGHLFIVAKKRR